MHRLEIIIPIKLILAIFASRNRDVLKIKLYQSGTSSFNTILSLIIVQN